MNVLDPLIKLEALDHEFKMLTEKLNVVLNECCHSYNTNPLKYPKAEEEKFNKLTSKLTIIASINDYDKIDCSMHRGLRMYYINKNKCENIRPNEKESMQIRLWKNMEKYCDNSAEMNDTVFLLKRK